MVALTAAAMQEERADVEPVPDADIRGDHFFRSVSISNAVLQTAPIDVPHVGGVLSARLRNPQRSQRDACYVVPIPAFFVLSTERM